MTPGMWGALIGLVVVVAVAIVVGLMWRKK
jgi:hypothetical protein